MKIVASACLILLAACGGDDSSAADAEPDCMQSGRGEIYAPGMEHIGGEGFTVRLMDSVPAPPARFDNTWTLVVLDDAQVARDDATITVFPFMPDHGHGTPTDVVVTPAGAGGSYELDPINLWMPGLWEVRIDVDIDAISDDVVFAFCIEE